MHKCLFGHVFISPEKLVVQWLDKWFSTGDDVGNVGDISF